MLDEETSVDVHRQDVTGYPDRDRTIVLRECRFYIPNLAGQQKLDAVSLNLSRSQRGEGGWIPGRHSAPFFFSVRFGVDHPRECAFECLTLSGRFTQRLVSLEWRPAIRHNHERGAGAT